MLPPAVRFGCAASHRGISVNNYGNSKLEGEKAVLLVPEARTLVIRVPVMYAFDCEALKESASLTVAKVAPLH